MKFDRREYVMEKSTKILVFDFDGVIANSIHESFMTAINTYIQIVPDHSLPILNPLTIKYEKREKDRLKIRKTVMPKNEIYFK